MSENSQNMAFKTKSILILLLSAISIGISQIESLEQDDLQATTSDQDEATSARKQKDFRWPNKQMNVLIDFRSLNETERQKVSAMFDQIEHKTCVRINRLPAGQVNPFDTRSLNDSERNFIYIFKSPSGMLYNRPPSMGLSTFGCVKQGRQSMVLTDMAFTWPELVLRYHVLRSLGVESLERPDGQVRRLLNQLPLSQKITNTDYYFEQNQLASPLVLAAGSTSTQQQRSDSPVAYAPLAGLGAATNTARASPLVDGGQFVEPVQYLAEHDLTAIKQLYNCTGFQNRLSLKPLRDEPNGGGQPLASEDYTAADSKPLPETNFYSSSSSLVNGLLNQFTSNNQTNISEQGHSSSKELEEKLEKAEESTREVIKEAQQRADLKQPDRKVNETLIDEAAKSIVEYLLAESEESLSHEQTKSDSTTADRQTPTTSTTGDQLIDQLFDGSRSGGESTEAKKCENPLDSCPISSVVHEHHERSSPDHEQQETRPMTLKLDSFHAQDPQLQQADQMKLSQVSNSSLETYRLLNADWVPAYQQQQQQFNQFGGQQFGGSQNPSQPPNGQQTNPKSEMLISFEQSAQQQQSTNPVAALATSQVLKLCSCTCQTMTPAGNNNGPTLTPPPPPPSSTSDSHLPLTSDRSDPPSPSPSLPATKTTTALPPSTDTVEPTFSPTFTMVTTLPPTLPSTTTEPTTTQAPPSTSELPTLPPPTTTTTTTSKPTTNSGIPSEWTNTEMPWLTTLLPPIDSSSTPPLTSMQPAPPQLGDNACDSVQWVKPNKTVYSSAKIVWDVDRANQNYFLCNNIVNGELLPGKTHGFSCKVSTDGKAYEMHNFSVLTKPENVNLAWVQRNSDSFGTKNLPVIGGFSKTQDPYVVSRCLVRDENNDVITLIGYVNSQGVGQFPFDDIQIECAQYDVLACVT